MKKNSQKKSSFGLLFALIALLLIGLTFGSDVLRGIVMWIAIFAVAIFVMGVAIVLVYTIKEEIMHRRKKKENINETPSE